MKKKKGPSKNIRIISFIVGLFLLFLGGIDFFITTIPGILLIMWAITGTTSFNFFTVK